MSRIAIASMFRNSEAYIQRYVDQMARLTGSLCGRGHTIHLIAAEGDSSDNTWAMLNERLPYLFTQIKHRAPRSKLDIFKAEHGGPVYGSIDHEQRWRNISFVCDQVLEAVDKGDRYLIYVESDLIWDTETMERLLGHLEMYDAVAPLCIHKQTGYNYETWGHRKNGQRFQAEKPYHPEVDGKITPIDSAGSCIVMRGKVARTCRFVPPEQGIVGFGYDINAKGFKFVLDPTLCVHHP